MKLSLEALQVLDAIDRRGSFAAAADELHRVPSAITYSVRQLEEGLGVEVFDRKGHRAVLTAAGRELLNEGRRLLQAAADLECSVRRMPSAAPGRERVVSTSSMRTSQAPRAARASSQLATAATSEPKCNGPVGDGAKRPR